MVLTRCEVCAVEIEQKDQSAPLQPVGWYRLTRRLTTGGLAEQHLCGPACLGAWADRVAARELPEPAAVAGRSER